MMAWREENGTLYFACPEPVVHPAHPHITLNEEGKKRVSKQIADDLLLFMATLLPDENIHIIVGGEPMAGRVVR